MPAERFVLDASVAVEWFLPSGRSRASFAEEILERISAGELMPVVPDLWHYELGSVLIAARRDKRISAAKLSGAQTALRALGVETLALEFDASAVVDLSQRFHMQGYDVVYFELARRLAIPIATLDGGIKTACKTFGVKML